MTAPPGIARQNQQGTRASAGKQGPKAREGMSEARDLLTYEDTPQTPESGTARDTANTEAGLSTRAIAPVVGVSNFTVHADQAAVRDLTPEAPETPQGEPVGMDPSPRPPVTGIDGKTYTSPPPGKQMRGAQRDPAETYLNLIEMQAARAAREVKNLTPDQIRRIRPKADLWTVGLRNSIEVLQHLVDSLDPKENK